MQWIILVGSLDGIEKAVGPFPTEREARAFAIGYGGEDRYEDWISMAMIAPADDDNDDGKDEGNSE
jgi:hypothetical protein